MTTIKTSTSGTMKTIKTSTSERQVLLKVVDVCLDDVSSLKAEAKVTLWNNETDEISRREWDRDKLMRLLVRLHRAATGQISDLVYAKLDLHETSSLEVRTQNKNFSLAFKNYDRRLKTIDRNEYDVHGMLIANEHEVSDKKGDADTVADVANTRDDDATTDTKHEADTKDGDVNDAPAINGDEGNEGDEGDEADTDGDVNDAPAINGDEGDEGDEGDTKDGDVSDAPAINGDEGDEGDTDGDVNDAPAINGPKATITSFSFGAGSEVVFATVDLSNKSTKVVVRGSKLQNGTKDWKCPICPEGKATKYNSYKSLRTHYNKSHKASGPLDVEYTAEHSATLSTPSIVQRRRNRSRSPQLPQRAHIRSRSRSPHSSTQHNQDELKTWQDEIKDLLGENKKMRGENKKMYDMLKVEIDLLKDTLAKYQKATSVQVEPKPICSKSGCTRTVSRKGDDIAREWNKQCNQCLGYMKKKVRE
jgi:hypothetical protein